MDLAVLVDALSIIPDSAWGAAIGGYIAYKVAKSSNHTQLEGLTKQLALTEKENDLNRKIDFRKDVYLSFAAEYAALMNSIGGAARMNIAKETPNSLVLSYQSRSAQATLIADQATTSKIIELNVEISKFVLDLTIELQKTVSSHTDIDSNTQFYNRTQDETQRILAELRRLNESNVRDEALFDVLNRSFDGQMKMADFYTQKITASNLELQQLIKNISRFIMDRLKEIAPLGIDVMIAMKSELKVDIDSAALLKKLSSYQNEMQEKVDEILRQ